MSTEVIYALGLSLLAGLATGIGSLVAFSYKRSSERMLSFALGLSAGVMIFISFGDLLFEAREGLAELTGSEKRGFLYAALAFFGGIGFAALADALIPAALNPHHKHGGGEGAHGADRDATRSGVSIGSISKGAAAGTSHTKNLERMGIATAIAIAIHNLPEGVATFVSALDSPRTGIAVAIAVALHNIPIGVAISTPIYLTTGRRRRALAVSLLSGMAELVGALLAWALLMPVLSPLMMELVAAGVAGIMVFISLDGLLPAARRHDGNHTSLWGLVTGMALMAASIYLLH
ncbi:MAG: zinc transporter ZupT [Alistipes sp.]|jgi:ZIP family zinc transporter|nr:zinc transporter ZupT [Alistipes sp.]